MKRLLDILISLLTLVVFSPLLCLVSAVIMLDSGFPVFFSQQRIGRNFRRFRLWKFRTMRHDGRGPSITVAGDTRITRVGTILRKWKIDEIPQFWNVLCGDMSLVGPRPEVPEYVDTYRERYQKILLVRPGITDLASIHFRNEELLLAQSPDPLREYRETILPIKLRMADTYIGSQSLGGDIAILFQTLMVILAGKHLPARNH